MRYTYRRWVAFQLMLGFLHTEPYAEMGHMLERDGGYKPLRCALLPPTNECRGGASSVRRKRPLSDIRASKWPLFKGVGCFDIKRYNYTHIGQKTVYLCFVFFQLDRPLFRR